MPVLPAVPEVSVVAEERPERISETRFCVWAAWASPLGPSVEFVSYVLENVIIQALSPAFWIIQKEKQPEFKS